MNYRIIIFSMFITISLLSCGGGEKPANVGSEEEKNTETSKDQRARESCLLAMAEEPIQLLAAAKVEEVAQTPEGFENAENVTSPKNPVYRYVSYQWPSDRKMTLKVGDRSMEMEAKNSISFGHVEDISDKKLEKDSYIDYFNRAYGPKTAEQREKIKQNVDRAQENSGKVDESSAETIKAMLDQQDFLIIEGIGDRASRTFTNTSGLRWTRLYVLDKNAVFYVEVDVSSQDEEDLVMAKKIAQAILDNCKS